MAHRTLGALAAALLLGLATPALAKPPLVGAPAPDFTITTFDKRKVTLAELRGKVIVINHWATWCGPCKAEMPMMSELHRRYQKNGFEIFGVTTEDSVGPSMLKKVAAVLSYPLARGIKGNYPVLRGVPTSYVIDRAGNLRYAKAGSFETQDFIDLIVPLLREPAPE